MIVEDNRQVRVSVVAVLEAAGDIVVCGEAEAVPEAEQVASSSEPDVAIIDLRLGGDSGIRAGREVRARRPQTHVILLTSASDEEALFASALAGADGYLVKQLGQSDIVGAVRTVGRGGRLRDALSPADLGRLRSRMGLGPDMTATAGVEDAAAASEDVFDLVIEGRTDPEIADALHLDDGEVRRRVAALVSHLETGRRLRGSSVPRTWRQHPGQLGPFGP